MEGAWSGSDVAVKAGARSCRQYERVRVHGTLAINQDIKVNVDLSLPCLIVDAVLPITPAPSCSNAVDLNTECVCYGLVAVPLLSHRFVNH